VDDQQDRRGVNGAHRRPAPTIYDIARLTGVSPSTVSRALNKPGRINAKTEQRIRDAAHDLGYRLNPMARALPTGRTGTLALLLSDITNPVYFDLVRGAERVTAAHGATLVLAESQESAQIELATAERLQPAVDGVVLVSSRLTDAEIVELARVKPLVLVNRRVAGLPAVVPDVVPGLHAALEHLQRLGHRSVAFLSGPPASWMSRLRWETLFEQAVARGMAIVEIGPNAPTVDGGAAVLRRVRASGVSAVLAYNDLMAMGLLRACRQVGVAVPEALSIVGFDDIFGADMTSPALTTVHSPLGQAGEAAVRAALGEVDGVDAAVGDAEPLPTELVVRESTAPPHH
jgi:LacI family transcriptional regulator